MFTVPFKSIIVKFGDNDNSLIKENFDKSYLFPLYEKGFYDTDYTFDILAKYITLFLMKNDYLIVNINLDSPVENFFFKSFLPFFSKNFNIQVYSISSPIQIKEITNFLSEEHINLLPSDMKKILNLYDGICLVPDIHGEKNKMDIALDWSFRNNYLPIFMGDIIDHGQDSLECIKKVYDLLLTGKCIFIIGNHERRLIKWINSLYKNITIPMNSSAYATLSSINRLSQQDKEKFFLTYRLFLSLSRTHFFDNNIRIVHAGWKKKMDNYSNRRYLPRELENFALNGIYDVKLKKNVYPWVNDIPSDISVYIAHDTVKTPKKKLVSVHGGECYLLDMGCGKGGILQLCILKRNKEGKWHPSSFILF